MQDIIIRGGTVFDGTGRAGCAADVAVKDGRISAIGDLSGVRAVRELDASGLAVAPGFIDSHAHSDTCFVRDDSGASKLYQGVTTEVTGQCGSSPFPVFGASPERWESTSFEAFLERFGREGRRMAVNQAILVGHGTLREAVAGCVDRPLTPVELERMKALLRRDLEAGAWGMSLGLEYAPGFFADEAELAALGAVVAEYDGLVPCHLRSEGLRIDAAIDELMNVGRASGVHVHVSHLKLDNRAVHGRAPGIWEKLEAARREGVRVSADMYPYTASSTTLSIRCPKWSLDGGPSALLENLRGPRRAEILEGIRAHYPDAERAETCLISDDRGYWPQIVGKTLRYVAEEMLHTNDYAAAAAEILERTRAQAWGIFFVMSEADMLYFLSKDVGIGSDGYALPGDPAKLDDKPHPRSFGALAEFFRLARERGLCPLEEAVRRVTSKPADMIGLTDRGRLREGLAADIAVFDPWTIAPRATYVAPVQLARGVRHVLVNGRVALENGAQTEERSGRFLRKGR